MVQCITRVAGVEHLPVTRQGLFAYAETGAVVLRVAQRAVVHVFDASGVEGGGELRPQIVLTPTASENPTGSRGQDCRTVGREQAGSHQPRSVPL